MTSVITTENLVKTFGATRALDGLDLTVTQGEVHGFLGPNGAGKSTTIRVLLGILKKDSGTAKVFGKDPWSNAVELHARLAYVPGDVELWPTLTGGEALDLLGKLHSGYSKKRRDALVRDFDLDTTKRCRTYSKGNRQKVAIVAALASEAELLLLDEPTAGLDPLMEVVFQNAIHEVKRQGKTVLLSSHILAQVEKLADTISIIRKGTIVESGNLIQMRHFSRTEVDAHLRDAPTGLEALAGIHNLKVDGRHVTFSVDGSLIDDAVSHLSSFGLDALTCHPPTLEEIMLRHYGDELNGRNGALATLGGDATDAGAHS